MRCLINANGNIVERDVLKESGWQPKSPKFVSDESLNTAMERLNKRLIALLRDVDVQPRQWIETLRGRGYRLIQGKK